MSQSLKVPSGVKITITGLFRQIASLKSDDINYIFENKRAKKFRQPIGELLGKAFAGRYNLRRKSITKNNIDFWKLKRGNFRKKFIETAINAKIHGIDLDLIILCAEELAQKMKLGSYPSPHLVCGEYVFGEVINGWSPGEGDPPPPDVQDELPDTDKNEDWIWQPGLVWSEQAGEFVKDVRNNN